MPSELLEFEIDGNKHIVQYELNTTSGKKTLYEKNASSVKQTLSVDNENVPIEKASLLVRLVGLDQKIMISGKECRVVVAKNFFDVAVDGKYIKSKKQYYSLAIPWWAWIFVVACISIIVFTRGGALPAVLAFVSPIYILQASAAPQKSIMVRFFTCLGITLIAWAICLLVVFVFAAFLASAGK